MMKKLLSLLPLYLLFSGTLIAGESESKKRGASKELELSCLSCNSYVLTYEQGASKKYICWDKIVKPSYYVMKDLSSLIPARCLPTIYCLGCKSPCAEAVTYHNGDNIRAVYKILSAA